jgi:hypothetical protein
MARFLVTYHGSGMPSDPALMEQAKAAFGAWLASAGDAVVDPGAPVALATQVASGEPLAAVDVGGYSIIQANDAKDAAAVLASRPYVGRGGTLRVNQIIEVS